MTELKIHVKPLSFWDGRNGCDVYRCLWDAVSSFDSDEYNSRAKHLLDVHKIYKFEELPDETFVAYQKYESNE